MFVAKLFFFLEIQNAEVGEPVFDSKCLAMCAYVVLVFRASHSLQECEASCAHLSDYLLSDCMCLTDSIRLATSSSFSLYLHAADGSQGLRVRICLCVYCRVRE